MAAPRLPRLAGINRGLIVPLACLLVLPAVASPSYADTIELPPPQAEQLGGAELFQTLSTSRDQLPGYLAPGGVRNDELVEVQVAADGTVEGVTDHQRIRITGTGDYMIREAGPVLAASGGSDAPVLNLGDVLWQGFSPGGRQLAAELKLDPQIESSHLPLRLSLSFTPVGGRPTTLGRDGQLPGAGTVTLTMSNASLQRTTLPSGQDAAAGQVAAALDRMVALNAAAGRLPTIRSGLPATLPVTAAGTRRAVQLMPLRIEGTLGLSRQRTGAGPVSSIRVDAMLRYSSRFTLAVSGPGTLSLELTATPMLDQRVLRPPRGFASWSAWATADPPGTERKAALDTLVQLAATGSRASAYSPYLGSELPPAGQTTFRFTLLHKDEPDQGGQPLTPRPVPIGLAILAGLLLIGAGTVLWRRS